MTETSIASMLVLDYWLLLRPAASPEIWRFGAPIIGLLQQVGALSAACGEGPFTQQHFVQEVLRKLSLYQDDARLGHSVAGFFVSATGVCLTRGLARPKARMRVWPCCVVFPRTCSIAAVFGWSALLCSCSCVIQNISCVCFRCSFLVLFLPVWIVCVVPLAADVDILYFCGCCGTLSPLH
jgi:hypothetical protein